MNIDADKEINDNDFAGYPTIEEFKFKLEQLYKIILSGLSHDEIAKVLFTHIPVLPSLIANYEPQKFNSFKFYRVRLNIDPKSGDDLNLISTYSYPPPKICAKNGRCNIANKSVFYASNSAMTAIIESRPKGGDVGYLSIWRGHTTKVMKAGVLLHRDLPVQNPWNVLTQDLYPHLNAIVEGKLQKKEYFNVLLDFIADLFTKEQYPYIITSSISNHLLYGHAWKDFILYPSFVSKSTTTNMAFHPNVVDRYLAFEKVMRFRIISDHNNGLFTLGTGRVGELENNNMKWRDPSDAEMKFYFPGVEPQRISEK